MEKDRSDLAEGGSDIRRLSTFVLTRVSLGGKAGIRLMQDVGFTWTRSFTGSHE
jgi:hypothetical protein